MNPLGVAFVDRGLGDFLRNAMGVGEINPNNNWTKLAEQSDGKLQTVTARNADKRAYSGFVKSYFHNGVIKDVKMLVHFYNPAQILPKCAGGNNDPGFGKPAGLRLPFPRMWISGLEIWG